MPNFDNIDGIKINMYNGEHWQPHIHAEYGDEEVLLVIEDGSIYEGYLPVTQLRKARKWLLDNKSNATSTFKLLNPHLYAPRKQKAKDTKRKKR
jgi:hypothetical protein